MAEQKGCKKKMHIMSTAERNEAKLRCKSRKLKRVFQSSGHQAAQDYVTRNPGLGR